jgi:hypothetical protein
MSWRTRVNILLVCITPLPLVMDVTAEMLSRPIQFGCAIDGHTWISFHASHGLFRFRWTNSPETKLIEQEETDYEVLAAWEREHYRDGFVPSRGLQLQRVSRFSGSAFGFIRHVQLSTGRPNSGNKTWPTTTAAIWVPLWFLSVIFGLFPLISFVRGPFRRWRHRHRREGHCEKCDYDLTGNLSGVCPECGIPIKPGESTQPPHT